MERPVSLNFVANMRVATDDGFACMAASIAQYALHLEKKPSAEGLARAFHEIYEQLAPLFGYETRKESRTTWDDAPKKNRELMIATCARILREWESLKRQ